MPHRCCVNFANGIQRLAPSATHWVQCIAGSLVKLVHLDVSNAQRMEECLSIVA